jgi:Domain of unknown function (DUF6504)
MGPVNDLQPIHFYGEPIEVRFDSPPLREKTPPCPDGFTWLGRDYPIVEKLAEWSDFTRRGRMEKNMRPSHQTAAASHGSLGVGRFYFRVRVEEGRIFDLYYDRAPKDAGDRKGHWFLYRELE